MASETIRVSGLNELVRAFGKLDKELKRDIQRELSAAADIVSVRARERLAALGPPASPRTVGGIRPRVRGASAFVEQRLGKTTAKRGDWGSTQMRLGLVPALTDRTDEVVERLDRMLDRLGGEAGF